jgi:hypothetical protein
MIGTQHDLVHKPMPALRDLRNRIAHHEPIFSACWRRISDHPRGDRLDICRHLCLVVHHSTVPTLLYRSRLLCRERAAIQTATTGDRLVAFPRIESDQAKCPKRKSEKAVQLLDLMLEFFTDDAHWTRGCYDDGHGSHCLVGALLHLSREHRLPSAPVIALLQDAMPRPGLPLRIIGKL